jgi:integral membrane protein (TIGR01906 family)
MRPPRFLEVGAAALMWGVLLVGLSVLTLTIPVYTSALTQALGVSASSGLSRADVTALAGQVRSFVADPVADPLPATWRGSPAFGPSEVSHLRDVRAVLSGTRMTTGVVSLLLACYVAWCVASRRFIRLRRGMLWGAVLALVLVGLAALAALADFGSLFAAFHGLFFAAGTWTFPYDSLLIRLFPEPFWAASGAAWAGLSAALAGVLALAARLLRAAAANKDASRTANNV